MLLPHTNSIGSHFTSSLERAGGEGVRLSLSVDEPKLPPPFVVVAFVLWFSWLFELMVLLLLFIILLLIPITWKSKQKILLIFHPSSGFV
jgi:hypothetical protein